MFTNYYSSGSQGPSGLNGQCASQGYVGSQGVCSMQSFSDQYKVDVEEKEINLDNPIFVYYLDTRGITRQRLEETAHQINRVFPKIVTLWIVPSEQPSKIECVYDGKLRVNNLKELHSLVSDIHTELDNSSDFSEFKIKVRDLLLNSILSEES
jgi:hypothetical protein